MVSSETQPADVDELVGAPSLASLWTVIVVGGALGAVISLAGREDVPEGLLVWAAVAVALTATAGVVAIGGWTTWRRMLQIWPGSVNPDLALAAGVVLLVALAGLVQYFLPTGVSSLRGSLLIGVATLGAVPPLMSMSRVSTVARHMEISGAAVIDALLALRLVLGRQLRGLGALVALATLALAASPFPATTSSVDDPNGGGTVLVLGGVGSAIVAVAYVPVALTLRKRVGALAKKLMPLPDENGPDKAPGLVLETLKGRQELTRLIMGERGIYDELVASLVVAGPLLTAAVGNYITA